MKIKKVFFNTLPLLLVGWAMVYAAAPSGWYLPNATLDPDCAPGDTDCFVQIIDQDEQSLTLSGSSISISGWNTLDISSVDTDDQTLSLSGTILEIADGNSVDISSVSMASSPWFGTDDNAVATSNTEDIYVMGKVGIGSANDPAQALEVNNGVVQAHSFIGKRYDAYTTTGHAHGVIQAFTPTDNRLGAAGFANTTTDPDDPEGYYFISLDETNDEINTTADRHLVVRHDGKVGIGTVDPLSNLDIVDNINDTVYAQVRNENVVGALSKARLDIQHYDGTSFSTWLQISSHAPSFTGSTIFSNFPTALAWKVLFHQSSNTDNTGMILNTTNIDSDILFGTNNRLRMHVDGDTGYVGIGTNNPQSQLHVFNATNTPVRIETPGNVPIRFYRDSDVSTNAKGQILQFRFDNAGSEETRTSLIATWSPNWGWTFEVNTTSSWSTSLDTRIYVGSTWDIGLWNQIPRAKLHVSWNLLVEDSGEVCTSVRAWMIRFDTVTSKHQGCDGTAWNDLY